MWTTGTRELFILLESKPSGDCRNLIMGVEKDNGWEVWRSLSIRFEPQIGIRRMREMAELGQRQNKRCKNATETRLIIDEIDRRKRVIEEIGGNTSRT